MSQSQQSSNDIIHGRYKIKRLPQERRANGFSAWNRHQLSSVLFFNSLSILASITYKFYQLWVCLTVQMKLGEFAWPLWALIVAELSVSPMAVQMWLSLPLFFPARSKQRPRYILEGDEAPKVDVCITCCGEEVDIILDTVAAVAAQDYPAECFTISVLDDGRDPKLFEAIEVFNTQQAKIGGPRVTHRSREKTSGVRSHSKAGNINFGINETAANGGEYFSGIDADMIVAPNWLRAVVPHLILDEGMALANPPQTFYNLPDSDPLGQEQNFFFKFLEPMKDRVGAAWCTGSAYVVKRKALAEIGGWPMKTVAEDVMCSTKLIGAGWSVAFLDENLQCGLAPGSLDQFLNQRMRWTSGHVQVFNSLGCHLFGKSLPRMHWASRASGFLDGLQEYSSLGRALALLLLPLAIFSAGNRTISNAISEEQHYYLTWLFLADYAMGKLNFYVISALAGAGDGMKEKRTRQWTAPYLAFAVIRAQFPNGTIFQPTGSTVSEIEECSGRLTLWRRICNVRFASYVLYLAFAATPFLLLLQTVDKRAAENGQMRFPFISSRIALLECIEAVWSLLSYLIFPPTVPDRGELVEPDERGVNRPKKKKSLGKGKPAKFPLDDIRGAIALAFFTWASLQ